MKNQVNKIFHKISNFPFIVKIFISLTLFVIIPIVIVTSISTYTILNYSEAEISNSGLGKLKVAQGVFKLITEEVSKDTISLSLNENLNPLVDIKNINFLTDMINNNYSNYINLNKTISTVCDVVRTNNKYQSVYLYLDDANYVVSSENSSAFLKENFTDTGWLPYYLGYKTDKAKLSWLPSRPTSKTSRNITGFETKTNSESAANYVVSYVYPLTEYTTKLNGAIVVNINAETINTLINGKTNSNDGHIIIVDSFGNVISHVDKKYLGKNISSINYVKQILDNNSNEGHLTLNIDGKRSLVTFSKSDLNKWTYIGIFSLDDLTLKASQSGKNIVYISFIIVTFGILLSYIISKKLYNPLKNLLLNIKQNSSIDLSGSDNEMALLTKAFESLSKYENNLLDILEKNKSSMRNNYLAGLISGNPPADINLDLLNIDFKHNYYNCSLVTIDHFDRFLQKYPKDQQNYIKLLISKVFEEIIKPYFLTECPVLDDSRIGVIINTETNNDLALNQLVECFRKIQGELGKVFDITISIGIGNFHEGQNGVSTSYQEAQKALKLKLIRGYGSINIWNIDNNEKKQYYYPLQFENHIFNYLNAGQKNEISDEINKLITELKARNDLSCDNILQIFNQLIANTVKFLVESHLNSSDIFGDGFNIHHELSVMETLDDIEKWIIDIYCRIIDYCSEPKLDSDMYIQKILTYIHANYKRDIDVNTLADHVGLSYSHVRKIFFDETGENIVNYINNHRIKEAKILLTETDMNIKDMATSLGYNNTQSFNRYFKKYEGITPSEYRIVKQR